MISPRCSCILVSSALFGRSSALGSIVVQGLGMLRIFLSLSFSFFSSVGIIHFATISVVHVVMGIFINQGASKLFIDF